MAEVSVVMAVCERDNPEYVEAAMHSIASQTRLPEEFIVIADGPIPDATRKAVELAKERWGNGFFFIARSYQAGPATVWNKAIAYASKSLIARMDADDIARPTRIERQVEAFRENPKVDVLGGFIEEFDEYLSGSLGCRSVPLTHNDIKKMAQSRNPMNHVTVMFKKKTFMQVGGYIQTDNFVDYYAWLRLLRHGAIFCNIDEVLVDVRAGQSMVGRRHGLKYLSTELRFFVRIAREGLIGWRRALLSMLLRAPVRVAPRKALERIYGIVRER